jgi:predicted ATP-dependent serine protease
MPQLERRLAEAAKLGFKRALIPATGGPPSSTIKGIQLIPCATVAQALEAVLGKDVVKRTAEPSAAGYSRK